MKKLIITGMLLVSNYSLASDFFNLNQEEYREKIETYFNIIGEKDRFISEPFDSPMMLEAKRRGLKVRQDYTMTDVDIIRSKRSSGHFDNGHLTYIYGYSHIYALDIVLYEDKDISNIKSFLKENKWNPKTEYEYQLDNKLVTIYKNEKQWKIRLTTSELQAKYKEAALTQKEKLLASSISTPKK